MPRVHPPGVFIDDRDNHVYATNDDGNASQASTLMADSDDEGDVDGLFTEETKEQLQRAEVAWHAAIEPYCEHGEVLRRILRELTDDSEKAGREVSTAIDFGHCLHYNTGLRQTIRAMNKREPAEDHQQEIVEIERYASALNYRKGTIDKAISKMKRELADKSVGESNPIQCTICCDRNVTHTLECGHLYCGQCATVVIQRERCPKCRANVSRMTRVYF